MNIYNSTSKNWANPLKAQFQRGTLLLKFVDGAPTAWVDRATEGLVIADTLLSLDNKDAISNAWTLTDAMIAAIKALTPGVRVIDCLFYAGTNTAAIDGGGLLDLESKHVFDPSGVPVDSRGRVK
jgi:hypothetical protein